MKEVHSMSTTRILTGGLATLAVSACFGFTSPAFAAQGEDRPCGSAAVGAVYTSVVVDPVFRTVPAVTHTEWRWQRDVSNLEFEFGKELSAAHVETDWSRAVPGETEYLFTHTVIDLAGVPAVPGTDEVGHFETVTIAPAVTQEEDEYVHQVTGKTRWESPDWGAQNGNGNGWVKTGNTRQVEVTPAVTEQNWVVDVPAIPGTPAVPEQSHTESVWAAASPGAGWSGPQDTRTTAGTTEHQTTAGDAPAGSGWVLDATRTFDAVIDLVWAVTAPDGYTPTGDSRVASVDHQESEDTSATAPAGEGWSTIDGSEITKVDVPETQVLVTPGSVDQLLVSPALPATAPCVQAPADSGTDSGGGSQTAGPQAAPAAAETAAPAATVLPNTGGVPGWMAPAGVAAIIAGASLVRGARRRAS
jgi:hypothetical protein